MRLGAADLLCCEWVCRCAVSVYSCRIPLCYCAARLHTPKSTTPRQNVDTRREGEKEEMEWWSYLWQTQPVGIACGDA